MVINVGIVGYGASAKSFHIPFIGAIPEYNIVAVLQRAEAPVDVSSAVPGSHCTVDLPGTRHYRTPNEFFADPDTALVVVATHIDTHALFAEKALLAGKHVIVDKPFARSTTEADKVIQLAKEKGLVLTCFQNRRWDGDFQTLRKVLSQNALGKIAEAEIHYDFESPFWIKYMTKTKYAPGEGHSFGLGRREPQFPSLWSSHRPQSLANSYYCQRLPQPRPSIHALRPPKIHNAFYRSQRGLESEIEDSFTVILQYDRNQKNLLVTVKSAITTPLAKQLKLFVRGSEGSFVKWQQRSTCPQEEQIARGAKPTDPGFGEEPETLRGVLTTYKEFDPSVQSYDTETEKYTGLYPTVTGRWTGLYENVADAICGRKELEVRPEQVRDVLRIIELARISHERGATVIWSDGD